MTFKSIQMKIAVFSVTCILGATAGLVGYSLYASGNSRTYVANSVSTLIERQTSESLQRLANTQAERIAATINQAFDAARNMARSFEVAAAGGPDSTPPAERRSQFNRILLNVLKDNPGFNGTYSAWEPDAIDGNDAAFRNRADAGSDATGRFLPYWTRDASGKIALQPLVEYDSQDLHPNGVMKGGWYIGPQTGKGESILSPLPYIVQGKNVYLATMSVPIMIDGKFRGVVGADYNLDFVQQLAQKVDGSIFSSQADVTIVSGQGLTVASSEHPEAIGGPFEKVDPALSRLRAGIESGKEQLDSTDESIAVSAPINFGRTDLTWSIVIKVPRAIALADAAKLDADLSDRNATDSMVQIAVAAVIGLAGAILMWLVARSIASPIIQMTQAMRLLAQRKFETQVPGVGRSDEIGAMAEAVQVFKDNGIKAKQLEAEAEETRRRQEVERERLA
ncbi:PDC sensor domain-containing protein, partial [Consotaella salsifontis]